MPFTIHVNSKVINKNFKHPMARNQVLNGGYQENFVDRDIPVKNFDYY